MARDPRRLLLFRAILAGLVLGGVELVSYALLAAAPLWLGAPILRTSQLFEIQARAAERMLAERPDALTVFDAQLGWNNRRGLATDSDAIDSLGLRAAREYAPEPAAGVLRIAAFGDSYTYGTEVPTAEAWPSVLEREHADLEVLNYGVPGFGLDQAYLRFQLEGAALAPRVVVLGATCHTIGRNVNVSSRELGQANFSTKPRFRLGADGALVLVPNPLERASDAARFVADPRAALALAHDDYSYEPLVYENPLYDASATVRLGVVLWGKVYRRFLDPNRPLAGPPGRAVVNSESEAFRIMSRILVEFRERARAAGQAPAVVVIPDESHLVARRAGDVGTCGPLLERCRADGGDCLDASEAFDALGAEVRAAFAPGGHYSAAGNAALARWLEPRLRERATR